MEKQAIEMWQRILRGSLPLGKSLSGRSSLAPYPIHYQRHERPGIQPLSQALLQPLAHGLPEAGADAASGNAFTRQLLHPIQRLPVGPRGHPVQQPGHGRLGQAVPILGPHAWEGLGQDGGAQAGQGHLGPLSVPYRVFNLGSDRRVRLNALVELLAVTLARKPIIECLAEQPGDMLRTWADLTRSCAEVDYAPSVSLETALREFVDWLAVRAGHR